MGHIDEVYTAGRGLARDLDRGYVPEVCDPAPAGLSPGRDHFKDEVMHRFLLPLTLGVLPLAAGCMSDPFGTARQTLGTMGPAATAKARQQQTIATIGKLKGEVRVDAEDADKRVLYVDLHGIDAAGALLHSLGSLTKLQELNLYRTSITDADLQQLRGLPDLQTLTLSATRISDAGLVHLQGLPSLRTLYLNETRITDAGLFSLRSLPQLSDLSLLNTPVTAEGLAQLGSSASLRKLTLGSSRITDQGLMSLKSLPNLREVCLLSSRVTDNGIENLKIAMPQLKVLH